MNGEEVEGRPRYSAPKQNAQLGVRIVDELSQGEKVDLMMFAQSEIAKTLFKLMEMKIISARDNAMACDPSKVAEQKALMDIAHAKASFYTEIRMEINGIVADAIAKQQEAEAEEATHDKEFLEAVILANATNQPLPERKPKARINSIVSPDYDSF